jgi:hypothetical protein
MDEFNYRNFVGEKNLNERVLDEVYKEIDYMLMMGEEYLKYLNNMIDRDELLLRILNLDSYRKIDKKIVFDIISKSSSDNLDLFPFLFDVNRIIKGFSDLRLNRKDIDKIRKYWMKKVKVINNSDLLNKGGVVKEKYLRVVK